MRYHWICEQCGTPIDDDDWEYSRCPECGGDIVDADECPNCGTPIVKGEEMFCTDCMGELATPESAMDAARGCGDDQPVWINGFLAMAFTPDEINAMLAAAIQGFDEKRRRKMEHKAEEYMQEFDAEEYLKAAVAGEKKEAVA
jgi:predicted amidophosphoribosyltransferase